INFYGVSCLRCGGDDFVREVAGLLRQNDSAATGDATERAEELLLQGRHRGLPGFDSIREQLHAARGRAFGRALQKEPLDRWKAIDGFAIGGAMNMPGVAETCLGPLPTGVGTQKIKTFRRKPRFADVPGATDLHGIAIGLSIPGLEFHEYDPPGEVPAVERASGHEERPVWDDRYAK
ncbi:hypothetical protein ACFL59_16355, partial [Planctomycetota bacterium]